MPAALPTITAWLRRPTDDVVHEAYVAITPVAFTAARERPATVRLGRLGSGSTSRAESGTASHRSSIRRPSRPK
jgi:hypothetical protein